MRHFSDTAGFPACISDHLKFSIGHRRFAAVLSDTEAIGSVSGRATVSTPESGAQAALS